MHERLCWAVLAFNLPSMTLFLALAIAGIEGRKFYMVGEVSQKKPTPEYEVNGTECYGS